MLKALSFLGAGNYTKVCYVWKDKKCYTHLFPEALAKLFEPNELIVFVTEKSKQTADNEGKKYVDYLIEKLDKIRVVDIPEGKTEEELWKIFEICGSAVEKDDEIIIDITHSFRSIPMFVLAAAFYLRSIKKITISKIVYGAFEARQGDNAPIFDLTSLVDLIEWLSGADAFILRGDATGFAQKLTETHRSLGKQGVRTSLNKIAGKLKALSLAISLSRPCESLKTAHETVYIVDKVVGDISKWAKPFIHILEMISKEMTSFSYADSEKLTSQNLLAQFELIKYMLDKGRYMQAVALAREWIISWVLLKRGKNIMKDKSEREKVEKALGVLAFVSSGRGNEEVPEWILKLDKDYELKSLWSWITEIRNDVCHCGMRKSASTHEKIVNKAKEIPHKLESIAKSIQKSGEL